MTTHPVLATDATLAHLNQFFDTWCNADDVTSIVQRIPVVKTLHDKEMTTTVSDGWYVAPRNVVMNIGKTRDDSETLTELSREVSGLARAISLSVLRSVAINAQTTSSVFTPSDVASSNTFAVEESMDHNANHVTRGDSPPPPARTNSLDRTMGPDDMRPPASPVPSARRPRNSSLAFANASLVGSPKDSSASDKSRRDMARALADMTALYLNAIQRQWTLERQLLLQEAELNETKEALDAYKNAESLHLPSGQLTSSHSVGSLNNAPHVAVVAARAKLFATQRDRACLSPDSAVRSNIQTTVASPVQLALGRSGGSGSATNFGEMPSFASMGGFNRHPQHHTAKAVVSAQAEADGSTTLNQYIILAEVGAGSQGKVLLAVDTECGETRAIKEIPRPRIQGPGIRSRMDNARLLSQLQREIAIMKRCRHKNVVALFEVIDDPDAANLYLVMQYVEHGPVARLSHDGHTKPIEPLKLASFARQLCAGLHYLHGRRVVHKDIKPENILLGANDTVFLADFGISSFDEEADEPQPFTLVTAPSVGMSGGGSASASMSGAFDPGRDAHVQHGTLVFRAPELLSGDGHSRFEPADVWALGLSLYVMLYGSLPWPLTSAYQYMQDVLNVDVKFPTTIVPYSPSPIGSPSKANSDQSSGDELPCASLWTELLSGMLRRDPGARLTAQQAHAKAKELHRLAEEIETSRLGVSTLSDQDIKQAFTTRRLVHPMPTPTPSA